ncbi:MAG: histidinol-phosphatase HisJ family protein [Anaerococcus hydrogenalis]|uniref:histidinol-phosphatase HisJ family protein n=1 Tax=Anaerococcus hydrogenalis TaxID=33029 RepID=UPI0029147CA3|nr:histidinol-phosphatase HisJ family protein [Anaerococcus hydrogenalis]MDU3688185.1 histidinol-phosphatase HisJ family protein [Anaerococcus hydrogenalis]
MQDLHLHSEFSFDSYTDPEENIKAAIKNNVKIMAFTDHMDNFCQNSRDISFDLEKYFSTIYKFREKYKNQIKILAGVEVGLACENADKINQFIDENPFDFVIGSIHAVEFNDIWSNRKNIEKNPKYYFRKYYQYMLESIKLCKNFSVLGHIDYIDRYVKDKSVIPDFSFYEDLIEEILKELVKTNRGIEYNTAGFRNNLSYANPKDKILEKYKDLGGKIITLGSDSHYPDTISYKINDGIKHLKDLGYKNISYFENKKEKIIEI